jgi:hypothetical protein
MHWEIGTHSEMRASSMHWEMGTLLEKRASQYLYYQVLFFMYSSSSALLMGI